MKYIKERKNYLTYSQKLREKLLLMNLTWEELIWFLEDNGFDISKLEELNKSTNSFFNKGKSGIVYDYTKDKIIKITTDISDYKLVLKLIGKKFKYLPNVYDVKSLTNSKCILLAILMEKCELLPDDLYNFIKKKRQLILDFFIYSVNIKKFLDTQETEIYEKFNLHEQFSGIKNELNSLKVNTFLLDLHENNFMMKNGNLCFIDFIIPNRYFHS